MKTEANWSTACPTFGISDVVLFLFGIYFNVQGLDPINIIFIIKTINFRGDLTDISAKTKPLLGMIPTCFGNMGWGLFLAHDYLPKARNIHWGIVRHLEEHRIPYHHLLSVRFCLAVASVKSPRKLFIFIINFFCMAVSQKELN